MANDDLASIDVQSGVNDKGIGFCTIVATSGDGRMWLGQMPPDTIREIAMNYLAVAEAAETDGILFRLLRDKLDLDIPYIGAFIADIRNERNK